MTQASQQRWVRRPDGSNWGDFGPDDELGRLNLLTPEKVLQGIAEVKIGKTFCLSLPLDYPGGTVLNPRRSPPVLRPGMRYGRPAMNYPIDLEKPGFTDVICDDIAELSLQYSTQWDSLAHVGNRFDADGDGHAEVVYYNGFKAGRDIVGTYDYESGRATDSGAPGARRLGIENMAQACIQGRAVMIDLWRHFGRTPHRVTFNDLTRILEQDEVIVEKGDIVLFHTGFGQILMDMKGNPSEIVHNVCAGLEGQDRRLLDWITDTGLVALVADNHSVEATPPPVCNHIDCSVLPLHQHCLFRLGVNLGELWYLTELADWLHANGRNRFLLTAPPLRLRGAVGSPLTPVATV